MTNRNALFIGGKNIYKVIQGGAASLPVVDYKRIYFKALGRVVEQDLDNKDAVKRMVLYGMNYIIEEQGFKHSDGELLDIINLVHCIKGAMGELTQSEIMTIFPITKKYDGNKKGIKDYFYTMNFLQRIGIDKPIGSEEKVIVIPLGNLGGFLLREKL